MTDPLTQVAHRALTDMIALFYQGGLSNATKQTIIEFYQGLKEMGEDVTEYEQDYANVVDDVRQSLIVPSGLFN